MKLLTALLALLVFAPTANAGTSVRICATVDNVANAATWTTPDHRKHVAYYQDTGETELLYDRPVPRAVRVADRKLLLGAPGPKVVHACAYSAPSAALRPQKGGRH